MSKRWLWVLLIIPALLIWGCPKSDDEESNNSNPPPTEDQAGQAVDSDHSASIVTPLGARIDVPVGAVPRQLDGSPGTFFFSIELDNDILVNVPGGETIASNIYRFGPESFTMARAVTITIPVARGMDLQEVRLYRVNPATGESEYYAGTYNLQDSTVSVQTYQFSPWFMTSRPSVDTGWGCAWVDNRSGRWVHLCVTSYELAFPEVDEIPAGGLTSFWAPVGEIGVASQGEWWLPQGTFTVCAQFENEDYTYEHIIMPQQIVIDNSAHGTWGMNWDCSEFIVGDPSTPDTGRCDCTPIATPPVGTGEVQVTLSWSVADEFGRDLDLHVVEPSGEEIYYGHTMSATGGQLDLDNICGDFRNGVAENIFWTTNPPAGEYIVKVHFFGNCGTDATSHPFNVRTVVRGVSHDFSRTVNLYETIEITRFSVSGGSVVFLPGRPEMTTVDVPTTSKN